MKARAFTMAEVLITLGIIGIVAAMTLPTILENVRQRQWAEREWSTAFKITQAMDKMRALDLLNGSYASTDEFVDELQKHLKIVQRCDASNLDACWPTKQVRTADGEIVNVADYKTGADLQIASNTTNNVGLVLADGSTIILTYNPANGFAESTSSPVVYTKDIQIGKGKSRSYAYSSDSTASIDFVMDVNGGKKPNSESTVVTDIRSFKTARFTKSNVCTGIKVGNICAVDLGNTRTLATTLEENKKYDPHFANAQNSWAAAQKACSDIGMSLASKSTLKTLYNSQTEGLPTSGTYWTSDEGTGYYGKVNAYRFNFANGRDFDVGSKTLKTDSTMCVD